MKQSQTDTNSGLKITRLVWVLSVVGLGTGVLTMGIQYSAWDQIKKQSDLVSMSETEMLESIEEFADERERLFNHLEAYLGKYTDQLSTPGMSSKSHDSLLPILGDLKKHFASMEFNKIESVNAVEAMNANIEQLASLQVSLLDYVQQTNELDGNISDIRVGIEQLFAGVHTQAERLEGRQRLKNSLLLRKYQQANTDTAPQRAMDYIENQRSTAELRVIKSELAELKVLVERLVGETQADQLVNLKDNKLGQTFARLKQAAMDVDRRYGIESHSVIVSINESVFGVGVNTDAEHLMIVLGQGGLYNFKQHHFELENTGRGLQETTSMLMNECVDAENGLRAVLGEIVQANADSAEATIQQTWRNAGALGFGVSLVFLGLTWHIAKLGRRSQSELRENNVRLKIAQKEAELASKSKSEFLANMSHEIRTPMTAILGFADTIRETGNIELAPVERIDAIDTIKRNGEHLLFIINDILDISKIEAGKLEVERIECSPIQLMADVQSLMRVRADAKGLMLDIEFEGSMPEKIQSDPTRLRQVLINVVGNAIKFTETGSVKIVASIFDDAKTSLPMIQFDVIDTGIGLTKEQSGKLFKAFSQADTSTTRKFGGTGLGLNISKRLAELLGGDIAILSEPGVGSTFRIQIETGPLDGIEILSDPASALIAKPEKNVKPVKTKQRIDSNILLAEDGPDNQKLISFVLKKAGAQVTIVENGKLALDAALEAKANGNPYDVILMDMQMPVMDGYEATTKLRQNGYTYPVIALTAHAMDSDRAKCINAGCDDFATKPIDKAKLISLIAHYTERRSAA